MVIESRRGSFAVIIILDGVVTKVVVIPAT
jgi:hypothetical protein